MSLNFITMQHQFNWLISLPVVTILTFTSFVKAQDVKPRNLLSGSYDRQFLQENITKNSEWHPYPYYSERLAWKELPDEIKNSVLEAGEDAMAYEWPPLTAELYLQYSRNGNRSNYQAVYFGRRSKLADLVIAECLEGKGRFLDQIINGIWALCEETSWCIPAHISAQKDGFTPLPIVTESVVDLFAAETGTLLAWTYYFLKDEFDKTTPVISERIEHEIDRRILQPVMERDDFWWMGTERNALNNWTPWIVSNWLACALIMEKDPEKKVASIQKTNIINDRFLNSYPADGGCDEGPGYWGHAAGSLFDCLELLYGASGKKIDIYEHPLIRNMGSYIYKAYIADDYYLNFADAAAMQNLDAELIYRFGQRIDDPVMSRFGAYLAAGRTFSESYGGYMMGRRLNRIFGFEDLKKAKPVEPLILDFWLPDLQVMGARTEEGSRVGLYVAAKGGHNAESHNHNDVGNYVVYLDGKPLIIDIGVEEYSRKTFSSERYTIWTMQSAYHTLPTINGHMQKDGRDFRAENVSFRRTGGSTSFTLDIAGAYPEEAGVKKWMRTIFFRRGRFIRVVEDYELDRVEGGIYFSYITPCKVNEEGNKIVFVGKDYKASLQFDSRKMHAEIEDIEVTDRQLKRSWGDHLRRIKLILNDPAPADQLTFTIQEEK